MENHNSYAFIFDMDGTLIDNMAIHNQIWIDYLTELGGTPDPQTFNQLTAGKTNDEIIRRFLGSGLSQENLLEYAEEKENRYRSYYRSRVKTLPGALDFLKAARDAGIVLALATSANRENVQMVMDGSGMGEFFPVRVTVEDITNGKPHPEIFLKAAERTGVPLERCLVFEDSYNGIAAGHSASMPIIAVTTLLTEEEMLALPGVKMAIKDFTEVQPTALVDQILKSSQPGPNRG